MAEVMITVMATEVGVISYNIHSQI